MIRLVTTKTALKGKIICNFTTYCFTFSKRKLLNFLFVHFTFSSEPVHHPSLNGYILQTHNVKPSKSSYISREDNRNGFSDFSLMKITQKLCPEQNLLQIDICSYILYPCMGQGKILHYSHRLSFSVT